MSTQPVFCACGHPERAHRIYCPTATERTTMTKTPPYVIQSADVKVGDLIEVTNTDFPDWLNRNRVTEVSDGQIHLHGEEESLPVTIGDPDPRTFRLLDRPEPPAPALPTTPGTVIRIGDNVWLLDDNEDWYESRTNCTPRPEAATDWRVVYDPTNDGADGLRERLEKVADAYRFAPNSEQYYSSEVYDDLCSILDADS